MNPICGNPLVEIRNRGSEFLTSATIQYGVEGGELSTYEWTGAMDFFESSLVELPAPNWSGLTDDSKFIASSTALGFPCVVTIKFILLEFLL